MYKSKNSIVTYEALNLACDIELKNIAIYINKIENTA